MKKKDVEFYSNFANYSDEDLILMKKNLIERYDEVEEEWTKELAEMWDEKFDQYSASGQRKIKKLQTKYADMLSDIEIVFEDLKDELSKRNIPVSELEDITDNEEEEVIDKNISEFEFVQKEAEKTQQYRQGIQYRNEENEEDE